MTSHDRIRHEVQESLRQATDQQLVRVMQFIDRLPSRRQVEDLVALVRPRLALVRPARPLTVRRVLTLPLEDLLADVAVGEEARWLIPREVLAPMHRIVLRTVPHHVLSDLETMAGNGTMDNRDTVLDIGQTIWTAGAAALRGFLLHGTGADAIGGPLTAEQRLCLDGIAQILENAADITMLLDQLPPKPMGRLRDDERGAALSLLYAMRHVSDVLFRYCYAMLMRRSSEPSEIFELVLENDFEMPTEQRDRILAEAARDCLYEIDTMNDEVAVQGDRSAVSVADTTQRMVSLIESLENAPSAVRIDAKRLSSTKARASQTIVNSFESTMDGEMRRAVADLAARFDSSDDDVANAEAIARSARKIELAGARLGVGNRLEGILNRELERYRGLILAKLRTVKGTPETRAAAIMDEVRLIEIVFGADAALTILQEMSGAGRNR